MKRARGAARGRSEAEPTGNGESAASSSQDEGGNGRKGGTNGPIRHGKRRRMANKVAASPDAVAHVNDPASQWLLDTYAFLDTAWCFCAGRRLKRTVKVLVAITNSLRKTSARQSPSLPPFTPQHVFALTQAAASIITVVKPASTSRKLLTSPHGAAQTWFAPASLPLGSCGDAPPSPAKNNDDRCGLDDVGAILLPKWFHDGVVKLKPGGATKGAARLRAVALALASPPPDSLAIIRAAVGGIATSATATPTASSVPPTPLSAPSTPSPSSCTPARPSPVTAASPAPLEVTVAQPTPAQRKDWFQPIQAPHLAGALQAAATRHRTSGNGSGTPVRDQRQSHSVAAAVAGHATHTSAELAYLQRQPFYSTQTAGVRTLPRKPAVCEVPTSSLSSLGDTLARLPAPVVRALAKSGIHALYRHQAAAIRALLPRPDDSPRVVKHVVVTTSTSSGKSLTYNLPVLSRLFRHPNTSTALYLFPTKALAQDQLRSLRQLIAGAPELAFISPSTYDGDVAHQARTSIRRNAHILFTNPDMVHAALLPHHGQWARFLGNLRFVVVDEAHTYVGVFGAHVAMTLRRLLRVAAYHGARPQVVCCTATIANPRDHFRQLVPEPLFHWRRQLTGAPRPRLRYARAQGYRDQVTVVTAEEDGSPSGERTLVVWNPPPAASDSFADIAPTLQHIERNEAGVSLGYARARHKKRRRRRTEAPPKKKRGGHADGKDKPRTDTASAVSSGATWKSRWLSGEDPDYPKRRSSALEAALIVTALVRLGRAVILFCKTRSVSERLYLLIRDLLRRDPASTHLADLVKSYRGGYHPEHRRRIERQLFNGELRAVVSTNALELGVDVGCLDAVVMLGYPGKRSSFWQQAGRAGRGVKSALVILVAYNSPVDQFFASEPRQLFDGRPELAVVNFRNAIIHASHVACAAAEVPLDVETGEAQAFLGGDDALRQSTATLYARSALVPTLQRPSAGTAPQDTSLDASTDGCASSGAELPPGYAPQMLRRAIVTQWDINRVEVMKPGPWSSVSLRAIGQQFTVVDDGSGGTPIDSLDMRRTFFKAYEGAVYLNQGVKYVVTSLDLVHRVVHVLPSRCEYYTTQQDYTHVNSQARLKSQGTTHFGRVQVISRVFGYRKIHCRTHVVLDKKDVALPPLEFTSFAVWTDLPKEMQAEMQAAGLDMAAGCHAAAHAVIAVVPLFVVCDAGTDLDTECPSPYQNVVRPLRFVFYDKWQGGNGVSAAAFDKAAAIHAAALRLLETCPCTHGCPSCCMSGSCGEHNYVMDKAAAVYILRALVSLQPSPSTLSTTDVPTVPQASASPPSQPPTSATALPTSPPPPSSTALPTSLRETRAQATAPA